MKHFDKSSIDELLAGLPRPFHDNYFAMYSSVYGGIVTDPTLMMIPIDDHVAHRGDGVFETLKCVNGGIYNLDAHLQRLAWATESLCIDIPETPARIAKIVVETVKAGGEKDCVIRVLVSRGPGSLGVNPYDCPSAQLYVVVASLSQPFMLNHPDGARIGVSRIPVKHPRFASVKSCNYVPNVLMKKEAVDRNVDFVVGFDEDGLLTECATANIGIVSSRSELLFPRLNTILSGTTMLRVMTLAEDLQKEGLLSGIANADITRSGADSAREVLVVGTTLNVVAVREFDGRPVGDGGPGPVFKRLSTMLEDDTLHNTGLRTPVFL